MSCRGTERRHDPSYSRHRRVICAAEFLLHRDFLERRAWLLSPPKQRGLPSAAEPQRVLIFPGRGGLGNCRSLGLREGVGLPSMEGMTWGWGRRGPSLCASQRECRLFQKKVTHRNTRCVVWRPWGTSKAAERPTNAQRFRLSWEPLFSQMTQSRPEVGESAGQWGRLAGLGSPCCNLASVISDFKHKELAHGWARWAGGSARGLKHSLQMIKLWGEG